MKPAPFDYVRPTSLDRAIELLSNNPHSKVLAGGQSLVPLLSMRLAGPSMLVDLHGIGGLDQIEVTDEQVTIGALATHAQVLAHADVRRRQPLLPKALKHVAHATIRNRGTTVGSIVHADAAAEMPAVLSVLGGSVNVVGPAGPRTIAAADLFAGPLESTLAANEIAVSASFPTLAPDAGTGFAEVARRHGDYAMCGVAVVSSPMATLASYLSVNDVPTVVDLTAVMPEQSAPLDQAILAAAGAEALRHLEPEADIHATVAYRSQLVRATTARALNEAWEERQ